MNRRDALKRTAMLAVAPMAALRTPVGTPPGSFEEVQPHIRMDMSLTSLRHAAQRCVALRGERPTVLRLARDTRYDNAEDEVGMAFWTWDQKPRIVYVNFNDTFTWALGWEHAWGYGSEGA